MLLSDRTDDDCRVIVANTLGQAPSVRIDVAALRAFSSRLSGNQLVAAARLAAAACLVNLATDDFVAQLQQYQESNLGKH